MKRFLILILPLLAACGRGDDVAVTELRATPGCVATAGSCSTTGGSLRVELQLPPAPEPLQPFVARVRVAGAAIEVPVLELSMVGMAMGDNRYRLVPDGSGAWTATVVLPVCILGRTDWVADVTFSSSDDRYRARFPFSTGT